MVFGSAAAIYIPTFYRLFSYGWKFADYSQGPLVLLAFLWLLWRQRRVLRMPADGGAHPFFLLFLALGLFAYVFGARERAITIESASMVPVLIGAVGFMSGGEAARGILFPALFLLFLVPPPLFMIDMLTSPLKNMVTAASAVFLRDIGYAADRDGVLLNIGDYTLVVGDACSGMRSLVSLMSVGALYSYVQKMPGSKRVLLFLSVLPISVAANTARLVALALITYYFGESAGQGFFHEFSGFFLFVVAVSCMFALEAAMTRGRKAGYAH